MNLLAPQKHNSQMDSQSHHKDEEINTENYVQSSYSAFHLVTNVQSLYQSAPLNNLF